MRKKLARAILTTSEEKRGMKGRIEGEGSRPGKGGGDTLMMKKRRGGRPPRFKGDHGSERLPETDACTFNQKGIEKGLFHSSVSGGECKRKIGKGRNLVNGLEVEKGKFSSKNWGMSLDEKKKKNASQKGKGVPYPRLGERV